MATKKANNFSLKLVPEIISDLKKYYPDAHCELNHKSPFQLLIATILSAQCTDVRVNQVTEKLFTCFPDALSMSKAKILDLEEIIRPTGFYKNKAKNIHATAQVIATEYNNVLPAQFELIHQLFGVGRKTANVVMGVAFNIASGIVVDTHVQRISRRLGWTKNKEPLTIEKDLMKLIPKEDWIIISHLLIFHGRKICKARSPQCNTCFLFDRCSRHGIK